MPEKNKVKDANTSEKEKKNRFVPLHTSVSLYRTVLIVRNQPKTLRLKKAPRLKMRSPLSLEVTCPSILKFQVNSKRKDMEYACLPCRKEHVGTVQH